MTNQYSVVGVTGNPFQDDTTNNERSPSSMNKKAVVVEE